MAAAVATHKGPVRKRNEDNHLLDLDLGLVAVLDGMGGHRDGDVASKTASDVFQAQLTRSSLRSEGVEETALAVETALRSTHTFIRELNRGRTLRNSMGTTIVGLIFVPIRRNVILFHVGDSRAYLWQRRKLRQLTRDHSTFENWRDNGAPCPRPQRNFLLQAVGVGESIAPTVTPLSVEAGDLMLLCSDGLTDVLDGRSIEVVLADVATDALQAGCDALLEAALAAGATDNITVALLALV